MFTPMTFLNESWFWTGFFAVFASLGSVLIREVLAARAQKSVERVRLHEAERFGAYKKLHSFTHELADRFSPPDDARRDFIEIMRGPFREDVQPGMLFFTPAIRELVSELEAQYAALSNSDLIPSMPFDEFVSRRLGRLIGDLLRKIEKQTDEILK
jgi:hypothetical protein